MAKRKQTFQRAARKRKALQRARAEARTDDQQQAEAAESGETAEAVEAPRKKKPKKDGADDAE
jgi:hypothetical protein